MALVDNYIRISRGELSPRQVERVKRSLTFYPNEETWVSVYRQRASTGELWLPRGAWDMLPSGVKLRDKRSFPKLPKLDTSIVLDYKDKDKSFEGQQKCIDAMFDPKNHQQGMIHRQPGTGKTNIALYFIAKVGTRSLVIVHTEDILNQWVDYTRERIPDIEIGIIRQKQEDVRHLTIATLQTLHKRNYPVEWWRQFGATFQDEAHHAAAKTFDTVLAHTTSRYRFGMSASKTRADKMEKLVQFTFGKTIHDLPFASPVPVTVEKIKSNFNKGPKGGMSGPPWLQRKKWQGMITRLIQDDERNSMIAARVNARLAEGRSVLVLSRRIEHLQLIQAKLNHDSEILAAALVKKPERKRILDEFRAGSIKCVLGTQLADEALDVPILSCIALTFPGKHSDLILQQVGRALRENADKHDAVIIDIVDEGVKTLWNHWHGRRRAYLSWGFKIQGDGISGKLAYAAAKGRRKVELGRSQLKLF